MKEEPIKEALSMVCKKNPEVPSSEPHSGVRGVLSRTLTSCCIGSARLKSVSD